jgi:hypothetical protein
MSDDDLGRVPMLLQDRQYLTDEPGGILLARPGTYVDVRDGRLCDGPASDRVAVVDLAEGGRATRSPAHLLPPAGAKRIRAYEFDETLLDPDRDDFRRFEDDTFVQLHVFGVVHATLAFFEQLLGRRIRWACADEQLVLVPWGGEGENAFYERESGSITFLTYTAGDRPLLLALSRDIVAHEAAHAVLDAVAPDLYDATDPDSLTIHEAVGDLSALLQTLCDETVVFSAYALFDGDVDAFEALGRLAEEFGTDFRRNEHANALRSASSDATFEPTETHRTVVDRIDPHEASAVVVGALFTALHERATSGERDFERAVPLAARELARILIPALHRLPAGDASLTDLARALDSAAAETSGRAWWRAAIARAFLGRGITSDAAVLRAPAPSSQPLAGWPGPADALVAANRDRLAVPSDVEPAATIVEFADRAWTKKPVRRVQLRVSWDVEETHEPGEGFSTRWLCRTGTTAVLDAETGVPISILSASSDQDSRGRRDQLLKAWAKDGTLETEAAGLTRLDPDGRQRAVGTARTLHLVGRRARRP